MQRSRPRSFISQPILAATVLAFLTPMLAFAGSSTPTWTNTDGHSSILSSGAFNLAGSEITAFDGVPTTGTLNFTTGATFTGSLATGGSWSPGGTITITQAGLGIVFQGTFTGTTSWQLNSAANCSSCEYSLSGAISGTYYALGKANGSGVTILTGSTVQLDLTTSGTGLFTGVAGTLKDKQGTTNVVPPAVAAEPGSLALMGTGFLGVGAMARRRFRRAPGV